MGSVRITYDPDADAVYVYLTDELLTPGRETVPCGTPGAEPGVEAIINLDFKDGRIVGLEVLDASQLLHADLLMEASRPNQ